MSPDLFRYLSADLPLGLWLLPFSTILFTLFWYSTWKGTGFWSSRVFWRVFRNGVLILIVGYALLWFSRRPAPIPKRIIISVAPSDSSDGDWTMHYLKDLLTRRLRAAPEPILPLEPSYIPLLETALADWHQLGDAAQRLRVGRVVRINRTSASKLDIGIYKVSGGALTPVENVPCHEFPPSEVVSAVERAAAKLGAKRAPKFTHYQPASIAQDHLRRFYSARASSEHSDSLSFASLAAEIPDWPEARLEAARWLLSHSAGIMQDSIRQLLLSVIDRQPESPEAYILLGEWALKFRLWHEAETALKLAYHYDASDPRTVFYLSRLDDSRLGDLRYSSKAQLLEHCLWLAPGYEAARLALSRWLISTQESRRGLKILIVGLEINPRSVLLLKSKSAAELELSLNQAAIVSARRLLEIDPTHSGGWYNLGLGLMREEDYTGAILAFETAYKNGGSMDNLFYIGAAYQKMERFEEAIRYYQRRMANPTSATDRLVASCRQRIQMLQNVIQSRDSVKANP